MGFYVISNNSSSSGGPAYVHPSTHPITMITANVRQVSTSGAILSNDSFIVTDATVGQVTLTMPLANTCTNGQLFSIKKIDGSSNAVVVQGVIDDVTSISLTMKNQSYTLSADKVNNKFYIV